MVVCNTRILGAELTGVQRYTLELLSRFKDKVDKVQPEIAMHGVRGHMWEQFVLPSKVKGRVLWSPSNTGPLSLENQVVSIMDLSPMDHPEWMSRQFSSWYRFLTPRLIKKVRKILTISEFTKQRILHYCPEAEEKIHVTHLAADKRFKPADEMQIKRVNNELNLPSTEYIVALGSLEPRKNLKRLLMAWKNIQHSISEDIWLVLAGAQGKKLVFGDVSFEDLPPRVLLTGHIPDDFLPALYSGAIASVYLSLYEGFGLPPLEAMSCGTPVITSNVSSIPEVVGNASLMVDPFDIEAIGDGLLRLIEDSDLCSNLTSMGLERAVKFDWDKTAKMTLEVLTEAENS